MTGTTETIEFLRATSNTMPNNVLDRIMQRNLEETPCPGNDSEDQELAERIEDTLCIDRNRPVKALNDTVQPYTPSENPIPASTDVGDVSWICPVSQIGTATWPIGTAPHTWQAVACGQSAFAHHAMLYAGQVIAGSAIDILDNPKVLEDAWEELRQRTNNEPYHCPIPPEIKPAIPTN